MNQYAKRTLTPAEQKARYHALMHPEAPVIEPPKELPYAEGLTVSLTDARAKIVLNSQSTTNRGNCRMELEDTQALRKALGGPLQAWHDDIAANRLGTLKSAEKKLARQLEAVDIEAENGVFEAEDIMDALESVRQLLGWCVEFRMAIFCVTVVWPYKTLRAPE